MTITQTELMVDFKFACAWNTGRLYTDKGQRIAVWRVYVNDKLEAYFMVDLDRDLYYFIQPMDESDGWASNAEVRRWVQECYDFNKNEVYPYQFAKGSDDFYIKRNEASHASYQLPDHDFPKWSPLYF